QRIGVPWRWQKSISANASIGPASEISRERIPGTDRCGAKNEDDRNPKSEGRRPKEVRIPKSEDQRRTKLFGLRISAFFRPSAFGFRILDFAPAHPALMTQIWDLHCHLSGVPGNTPEARLGKLLEYAHR